MEEVWKQKWEAEAEAVDGRFEEAEVEAKEKLTTVPSLAVTMMTWASLQVGGRIGRDSAPMIRPRSEPNLPFVLQTLLSL